MTIDLKKPVDFIVSLFSRKNIVVTSLFVLVFVAGNYTCHRISNDHEMARAYKKLTALEKDRENAEKEEARIREEMKKPDNEIQELKKKRELNDREIQELEVREAKIPKASLKLPGKESNWEKSYRDLDKRFRIVQDKVSKLEEKIKIEREIRKRETIITKANYEKLVKHWKDKYIKLNEKEVQEVKPKKRKIRLGFFVGPAFSVTPDGSRFVAGISAGWGIQF